MTRPLKRLRLALDEAWCRAISLGRQRASGWPSNTWAWLDRSRLTRIRKSLELLWVLLRVLRNLLLIRAASISVRASRPWTNTDTNGRNQQYSLNPHDRNLIANGAQNLFQRSTDRRRILRLRSTAIYAMTDSRLLSNVSWPANPCTSAEHPTAKRSQSDRLW